MSQTTQNRGTRFNPAAQGKIRMDKESLHTLKRIFIYIDRPYRKRLVLAFACIAFSAFVSVAAALFWRTLIDDYISPILLSGSRDMSQLLAAIARMGLLYTLGVGSSLLYQLTMVSISHGVLKEIRDKLFASMQRLPLRF